MKCFQWFANKQPGGRGLRHFNGTVEAHTVKEAWQQIDKHVAEYAQQGLIKGAFKLSIRVGSRWFADRCVCIPSTFADGAILDQ